jgi:hypothetical protein
MSSYVKRYCTRYPLYHTVLHCMPSACLHAAIDHTAYVSMCRVNTARTIHYHQYRLLTYAATSSSAGTHMHTTTASATVGAHTAYAATAAATDCCCR